MNFHEYMESQISGYEVLLSDEDKERLQEIFDRVVAYERAADTCMRMQFSSKAGIDYSTDYNKNMQTAVQYRIELAKEITALQEKLGISIEPLTSSLDK